MAWSPMPTRLEDALAEIKGHRQERDKRVADNKQLRARVAELEAQLADISVKRDVAVDTLEKVKADRKVAQQALAEQCKETKSLRDQLAERDAEIALLKTTPPDMRQDLHCVASDLARECREERERADANEAIVEHLQKLLLLAKDALEKVNLKVHKGFTTTEWKFVCDAIAAIDNSEVLKGMILCDAEPRAVLDPNDGDLFHPGFLLPDSEAKMLKLYTPRRAEK